MAASGRTAPAGCEAICRAIGGGWCANSRRRMPKPCAPRIGPPALASTASGLQRCTRARLWRERAARIDCGPTLAAVRVEARVEYRYHHFTRELMANDSAFSPAFAPGQQLPDFDLITTAGGRI